MNQPFTVHEGLAVALLREHIDTDAIIPSREMKGVGKTGLADGLFANWRYLDPSTRTPNPDFVLCRHPSATVLVAGANFGCGSSREHAAWALKEWGIRVVMAPSFGAIFFDNCVRNGLVPVVWNGELPLTPQMLRVDLERLRVTLANGCVHPFELDPEARELLLTGLDPIDRTRQLLPEIEAFESRDRMAHPWIYLAD